MMRQIFIYIIFAVGLNDWANAQDGIKKLIIHSIEYHPIVLSSQGQVNAAKMDIDAAKWGYYPTPSISYEAADKKPYASLDKSNKYFRLQQPVWTAGRLTAQVDKSESQHRAAELAVEEQKLNIAFKWLQLWSEYQGAEDKIKANEESEKKHIDYVRQIERRAVEGFSALNEVQLSLSRLSSVQADLRQLKSVKNNAASKLEQMIGKPLSAELDGLGDTGWPSNQNAITNWSHLFNSDQVEEFVNSHPTVQKAKIMIETLQADEALVKSRNMPELYLRSEIRQGDVTGTSKAIYFGLTSSFGSGLSNLSAVAAAQQKIESQRSEVLARQMEVREAIQADLQSFQAQFDRLGQLEKTYASNHQYLESSERQYLAGRRSWQEIMNIAREESQILVQIADAKALIWLMHQRLRIFSVNLNNYLLANTQPVLRNIQ